MTALKSRISNIKSRLPARLATAFLPRRPARRRKAWPDPRSSRPSNRKPQIANLKSHHALDKPGELCAKSARPERNNHANPVNDLKRGARRSPSRLLRPRFHSGAHPLSPPAPVAPFQANPAKADGRRTGRVHLHYFRLGTRRPLPLRVASRAAFRPHRPPGVASALRRARGRRGRECRAGSSPGRILLIVEKSLHRRRPFALQSRPCHRLIPAESQANSERSQKRAEKHPMTLKHFQRTGIVDGVLPAIRPRLAGQCQHHMTPPVQAGASPGPDAPALQDSTTPTAKRAMKPQIANRKSKIANFTKNS